MSKTTDLIDKKTKLVAYIIDKAFSDVAGRYTVRRLLDKSGWEVVEWPNPEVTANDKRLFEGKTMYEAEMFRHNLKNVFVAKAVLEAI